jgi:hypothetical protein
MPTAPFKDREPRTALGFRLSALGADVMIRLSPRPAKPAARRVANTGESSQTSAKRNRAAPTVATQVPAADSAIARAASSCAAPARTNLNFAVAPTASPITLVRAPRTAIGKSMLLPSLAVVSGAGGLPEGCQIHSYSATRQAAAYVTPSARTTSSPPSERIAMRLEVISAPTVRAAAIQASSGDQTGDR